MGEINDVLENLTKKIANQEQSIASFPLTSFLEQAAKSPQVVFRNIFQLFHDMVHNYVSLPKKDNEFDFGNKNEFPIYDCTKLFVEGIDQPFFADRLLAGRLVRLADTFREGTQQNKVYLFEGPPGSGKSVFLDALLQRFEEYTHLDEGAAYETIWKLDIQKLGGFSKQENFAFLPQHPASRHWQQQQQQLPEDYLEVPCPNHDHPILQIPKKHRHDFLDELILNENFKEKLFREKEYEWVLKKDPCTVCVSLYQALLEKELDFSDILKMLNVRRYNFNRKRGEGISVFNPSDPTSPKQQIQTNELLQSLLNNLFKDSNKVPYLYSTYAKTNNGIYALMDIKEFNERRFVDLHGIVSDGIHKVENLEEEVTSLFIGVLNPEDKESFSDIESFGDRIVNVPCPYVLNYNIEIEIYKTAFGDDLRDYFLPEILEGFVKTIISTRFNVDEELKHLLLGEEESKYENYSDSDLLILKMDLHAGNLPSWLSEEDKKKLTKKNKKKYSDDNNSETGRGFFFELFDPVTLFNVINMVEEENNEEENSEKGEGEKGFSVRKSIQLFNDFFSNYYEKGKLIDMDAFMDYFEEREEKFPDKVNHFAIDIYTIYNHRILEEIKSSLYDYNEEKISRDVKNYLFATSFDFETKERCPFTGDMLEINDSFFRRIEGHLLGKVAKEEGESLNFREMVQKEFLQTYVREIDLSDKEIESTTIYNILYNCYLAILKENVLEPFLGNDNFGYAMKDYGTNLFEKNYDQRIKDDVTFLIENLQKKFGYTEEGAKQICVYAIDEKILPT